MDCRARSSIVIGHLTLLSTILAGCGNALPNTAEKSGTDTAGTSASNCAARDTSITVPSGFCVTVFADSVGHARHLAVAPNGVIYVNTWSSESNEYSNVPGGFVVALRDADHNGRADSVARFGTVHEPGKPGGGTGLTVFDRALYVEVDDRIVRYRLDGVSMVPQGEPDTILSGLPREGDHPAHPFAIVNNGTLFVNSGSASNSCQVQNRTLESPGRRPCTELTTRAGIWRYDARASSQVFSASERFATGLRNTMALAIQPRDNTLYAVIHGRDQLGENWPRLYDDEQNSELPAEIMVRVDLGNDYGWPYCYYDGLRDKHVLAPEYGGDGGRAVAECAVKHRPVVVFPAHWAPEALVFYTGGRFPARYHGGAFVSFHGSWNRTPTQAGFLVAFVPFSGGRPSGRFETFASGFAGRTLPADPKQARFRPMGLAVSPDGALFVSDDTRGRIWRITYGAQAGSPEP